MLFPDYVLTTSPLACGKPPPRPPLRSQANVRLTRLFLSLPALFAVSYHNKPVCVSVVVLLLLARAEKNQSGVLGFCIAGREREATGAPHSILLSRSTASVFQRPFLTFQQKLIFCVRPSRKQHVCYQRYLCTIK